ncbi:MAG: hypothetical protein ACSHX0_06520 [Akkermansiaceae bacterium]
MKTSIKTKAIKVSESGFALIATISVMVLLVMIALAMLSLSTVEMRSSQQTDMDIARQNARLAMITAIGELQRLAGPDTRVTAPAEAVAGVNGPQQLTGVWRSWEGLDHDKETALPFAPDYGIKLDRGDATDIDEEGRFLGWLFSGEEKDNDANDPPSLEEADDTVPLLAEGTLGSGSDKEVHIVPTDVGDNGAMAWWIQGENVKALVKSADDEPEDVADWSARLASSNRPNPDVFGIEEQDELSKISSRKTLDLVGDADEVGSYFHDVTAYSRGLLTNTANGGWRRDLSLMAENYSSISDLKMFTLEPGQETPSATKASGAVGGLIYPWAEESSNFDGQAATDDPGAASVSWDALVDFSTKYKDISSGSSSGNVIYPLTDSAIVGRDKLDIKPMMARVHWVFSFSSENNGSDLQAVIVVTPTITLWNPYNVAIPGLDSFNIRFTNPTNMVFKFKVGDDEQSDYFNLSRLIVNNNYIFEVDADPEIWQPGEARIYSPNEMISTANSNLAMSRGYRSDMGYYSFIYKSYTQRRTTITGVDPLIGGNNDVIQVSIQYDTATNDQFGFDHLIYNNSDGFRANHQYIVDKDNLDLYWLIEDLEIKNDSNTLSSVTNNISPFLAIKYQLRNISMNNASTRGYSHTKPVTRIVSTGIENEDPQPAQLDAYPYDTVFYTANGDGWSNLGEVPEGGGEADPFDYIGTSNRFSDGLKSLIVTEIPTQPLKSLGELLNFDINYYNPMAPFMANPIGNSNASFLIEPDEVFINDGFSESTRCAYDHSYISNHLLFDDWFVSSIAPETNGYSNNEIRDTETVFSNFLSGTEGLPNSAYKPANPVSTTEADDLASETIEEDDSWRSIASEIEVEGMFNVNSTSVSAWTALLKHLDGGEVPYISNGSGTGYSYSLDDEDGHPVSRTTVAGDPEANEDDPDISSVGEHARITDAQIEALALEIVEQVKERGPFLSLSEFINRQLTTDTTLSLAGAVESALVELSNKGSSPENPFANLQDDFDEVSIPSGASYAFEEAAEGNSAYGYPGWIRQADILRPLAPILTVRDDTFVVRAYGESRDTDTGKVKARAWCETIVQRKADYMDTVDETDSLPSDDTLTSEINKTLGRRFSIISFRWMSPDEI